jgi:hypothetical protein
MKCHSGRAPHSTARLHAVSLRFLAICHRGTKIRTLPLIDKRWFTLVSRGRW